MFVTDENNLKLGQIGHLTYLSIDVVNSVMNSHVMWSVTYIDTFIFLTKIGEDAAR